MQRAPIIAISVSLALAGCARTPASEKLAVWTQALAATQADGPEVLLFKRGSNKLAFVGVQHDSDPVSSTHRLIESTFSVFSPKVVIVEGVPTSWGYNPAGLTELAAAKPDAQGLLQDGETVPTVRGALKSGSRLLGGEPSNADVRRLTAARGVSAEDLLGFYVLRVIPQWLSQRQFADLSGDRATSLIDRRLIRSRSDLELGPEVLRDAEAWRRWRLNRNVGADPHQIVIEEAGPLADGPWATSRIGAAISRARDSHLLEVTRSQLAEHGSVLVVFGGSHALIQLPALEALMGKPCYRGKNIDAIPRSCRS